MKSLSSSPPPVGWCNIDPRFSLAQGGGWASSFWFTQECLGYWVEHAKFCEKKVGFDGLMTAAVGIFCWDGGNITFCVCFCLSLIAWWLVRWRYFRERGFLLTLVCVVPPSLSPV